LIDIVNKNTSTPAAQSDPQRISDALLKKARQVAENSRGVSPFQERAMLEGFYYGGKIDDMTVLVGLIRVPEDSPDRR
jgi:hypothetical protein